MDWFNYYVKAAFDPNLLFNQAKEKITQQANNNPDAPLWTIDAKWIDQTTINRIDNDISAGRHFTVRYEMADERLVISRTARTAEGILRVRTGQIRPNPDTIVSAIYNTIIRSENTQFEVARTLIESSRFPDQTPTISIPYVKNLWVIDQLILHCARMGIEVDATQRVENNQPVVVLKVREELVPVPAPLATPLNPAPSRLWRAINQTSQAFTSGLGNVAAFISGLFTPSTHQPQPRELRIEDLAEQDFDDPITFEPIETPVCIASGHIFDENSIKNLIIHAIPNNPNRFPCPKTRQLIPIHRDAQGQILWDRILSPVPEFFEIKRRWEERQQQN